MYHVAAGMCWFAFSFVCKGLSFGRSLFFPSRLSRSVRHLAFFTSMCGNDDDDDDDVYSIAIHTLLVCGPYMSLSRGVLPIFKFV